jgi:hypothetical protein
MSGFDIPVESQEGVPSQAYEEMSLANLEGELARVARRKERLQHFESLKKKAGSLEAILN